MRGIFILKGGGGLVQISTGSCHCCIVFLCADSGAVPSQYTRREDVGHQVAGCQGSSSGLVINEEGRLTAGSSAARATLVATTKTLPTSCGRGLAARSQRAGVTTVQ